MSDHVFRVIGRCALSPAWMALMGITLIVALFAGCSQAEDADEPVVDPVLTSLARAYADHLADGGTASTFTSPSPEVLVDSGRVLVDATATGRTDDLLDALENLGIESAAAYGRIVSGWLPIPAIDDAAKLPELAILRPSAMATSRAPGRIETNRVLAGKRKT